MSDRVLLARLCAGPVSGAQLARELGLSRAAVWKRVQSLRAAGLDVQAVAGRGYALAQPLELLDRERLLAGLAPPARAELALLDLRFEIDSSNALAQREPAPTRGSAVFLCERQSAGRGRRGRSWASPLAAHVYLTLSRRFDGGIAALQGLSLAVGVAAAQALQRLGYADVALKWPNDLVVAGRKLGGILVEVGGDAAGPVRVAIGLGLNVDMPAAAAAGIDQPWCDLAALGDGLPPSRNEVAIALLNGLLPALARFERDGLAAFLDDWRRLDALAGQPVTVMDAGHSLDGVALGIGDDGALRVRHGEQERRYHGGEVSVRRGAVASP